MAQQNQKSRQRKTGKSPENSFLRGAIVRKRDYVLQTRFWKLEIVDVPPQQKTRGESLERSMLVTENCVVSVADVDAKAIPETVEPT